MNLEKINKSITNLKIFIIILIIKIKCLNDKEFDSLLNKCESFNEVLYALYFRYV